MSDELQVPASVVQSISSALIHKQQIIEQNLLPDESVSTTKALITGLKTGEIKGSCFVEWNDEKGSLRVNVIDFLIEQKVKAIDPQTGEQVIVLTEDVQDGSWRLLR